MRYFSDPTPSLTNGSGFVNVVNDTQFSVDRGFYDVPFELTISSNTPGSTIIFTTDGSLPSLSNRTLVVADETTSIPVAKMSIGSTTYVRAIAVKDRYLSTNVDTQTYLFLEDVIRQDPLSVSDGPEYPTIWQAGATADFEMDPEASRNGTTNDPHNEDFGIREALTSVPTMSIVMNHDDLWGSRGIYKNSDSRGETFRQPGSVEFFDAHSGREFQVNAGIQVHGGASRDNVRLKKHSVTSISTADSIPRISSLCCKRENITISRTAIPPGRPEIVIVTAN